ncbi:MULTISPECIES: DUF2087 domain-containing protein [unclassified Paenibacillus]|uniref:DUF2087 domain-containing protein n=1 Tax=unclassified Paenibacillus TaxID=185978 RepID=UPI0036270D0E
MRSFKQSVLNSFFSAYEKLKRIPRQYRKKLIVLEQLASNQEKGKKYTKKEINEFINKYQRNDTMRIHHAGLHVS